jgi:actin-binding protein anillin
MDSFTEKLLSRARERQKILQDYSITKKNTPEKVTLSEPNLNHDAAVKLIDNFTSSSEGNVTSFTRQNSSTHISSDFSSAKTLNIKNDNFNMEIKVSSAENVHVEVQIEEQNDFNSGENNQNDVGLSVDVKKRLNRLGKLYAGGEDANISSPIHQTESKFHAEDLCKTPKPENLKTKRGLSKLADLAESINQFEDDLNHVHKEKTDRVVKRSWKPPAPQPPALKKSSPSKVLSKPKAPNPPPIENSLNDVKWDKQVLDSLESQGFTRTDSSSRLVYNYNAENARSEKENVIVEEKNRGTAKPTIKSPQKHILRTAAIADKAARFESTPNQVQKDPALLSVSERKALFEKNKGAALIPKAPFAMATPIKSNAVNAKKTTTIQQSPIHKEPVGSQAVGIASKVAELFEAKPTISQQQIQSNVYKQRQEEMDVLLNRFHKTAEVEIEETEYDDEATEETAMVDEKPAKKMSICPSSDEKRNSTNKRYSKADSPKVAAVLNDVKRIKVSPQKTGRLYPSLTDIESVTETENESRSATPSDNSSFENSIAESGDANTSFGRDILRVVCKDQTHHKQSLCESDLSDVLDDMDDYIDEALAYNGAQSEGPTPPKKGRKSPIESSQSFKYKHFQNDNTFKSPMKKTVVDVAENLPTHVIDGDNILPLTHTVSFYRKQTQTSTTPIKQICRQPLEEEASEVCSEDQELIKVKMAQLKNEVTKQEMIISQTSQALNLCNSTPEFMGSTEQVEAERVLLLSTHRRQAALHELQRLEVEKTLRPQRQTSERLPLQKGTLTLSKIVLPLKQKYVTALAAAGGKGHHVVCLVKYADQVLPTPLVSTIASNSKNPELELCIPGVVTLENIYNDSTVTFEVYCLQAQEEVLPHEIKYHIKKPSTKLTPKKSKQESRLIRPVQESPAGPHVVRSPTFALMGYVVFSMGAAKKKQWSLNNAPSMSPLEGIVEMCTCCDLTLSVEHRGFLTMFEDISGFGAWHRRWCLLKGDTLNYWKYPDNEKTMPPINSISLNDCVTKQVGPVSRDICARLHTFLLEIERSGHPQDKESLVTVCNGPKTTIRHLLSADTKEERIEWCNKFNAALSALQRMGW